MRPLQDIRGRDRNIVGFLGIIKILAFAMNDQRSLVYDLAIVQVGDLEWPLVNESRLDSALCCGVGVESALHHGD
jgi:hypothetical protein